MCKQETAHLESSEIQRKTDKNLRIENLRVHGTEVKLLSKAAVDWGGSDGSTRPYS
jgi:hypothetical protein